MKISVIIPTFNRSNFILKAIQSVYEEEGKYTKQINAQDLWFKILEAQIEQGVPYILYKDAANTKSNQKNIGTIKSSNLCAEVLIHSSPEETGVCNLASICLPTYVNVNDKKFDFEKLEFRALFVRVNS